MPTMSATATATTTHEVKIAPALKRRLLNELKVYGTLRDQMKALEKAMDKHKATVAAIQDEIGEDNIEVEGYKIALVAPVRKVFNEHKFVAIGGDIGLYHEAQENVPSKSYVKISVPKEDD